jgi:hypothetical protein
MGPKDPEQSALETAKTRLHQLEQHIAGLEQSRKDLVIKLEETANRFVNARDHLLSLIEAQEMGGGLSKEIRDQRKYLENLDKQMKGIIEEEQKVSDQIEEIEKQAGQERAYVEELHDIKNADLNRKLDELEKRTGGKGGSGPKGGGTGGGSPSGGVGGGAKRGKSGPKQRWSGKTPSAVAVAGRAISILFGWLQLNSGLKERSTAAKVGGAGGGALLIAGGGECSGWAHLEDASAIVPGRQADHCGQHRGRPHHCVSRMGRYPKWRPVAGADGDGRHDEYRGSGARPVVDLHKGFCTTSSGGSFPDLP